MQQAILPLAPIIWILIRAARGSGSLRSSRPGDLDFIPAGLLVRLTVGLLVPCLFAPMMLSDWADPPTVSDVATFTGVHVALSAAVLPALWLDLGLLRWLPVSLVGAYVDVLVPWRWRHDHAAGGVVEGLRVWRRRPYAEGLEQLASRLRGPVLSGIRVYTEAELARARGQAARGDALFRILESLPDRRDLPRAKRLALRPRLADAASAGNWAEVERLGTRVRPTTALARLLADASRRARGAPTDDLWFWFVFAGSWRATLPLLRVPVPPTDDALPSAAPTDALTAALTRHQTACGPGGDLDDLLLAARAWDHPDTGRALDAHLARRAAGLGARTAPELLRETFLTQVRADLAEALRRSTGELPELLHPSPTWTALVDAEWERAAGETERAVEAMVRRSKARVALEGIDEWLEWNAVRESWERAIRFSDPARREVLFRTLWPGPCNHAVWLVNGRGEWLLAWAIFQWLRREGEGRCEADTAALLLKNEKASE